MYSTHFFIATSLLGYVLFIFFKITLSSPPAAGGGRRRGERAFPPLAALCHPSNELNQKLASNPTAQ